MGGGGVVGVGWWVVARGDGTLHQDSTAKISLIYLNYQYVLLNLSSYKFIGILN